MPAYQARHIASATRHLTVEQAGWVDAQLAPSLGAVSWGRLQTLLEAKIIQADPAGAEQQAAAAEPNGSPACHQKQMMASCGALGSC